MSLELTPEEEKIIVQLRQDDEQRELDKALFLRRIQTAAAFAVWMEENGAGATYSTFCGDFGYDSIEGENRSRTYDIIVDIFKLARKGV